MHECKGYYTFQHPPFFDIAAEMKGVISLGVGEPDFTTLWHTAYISNNGLLEFHEEIARILYQDYRVTYILKKILVAVSVSEALDIAM
ncbi:hypothetical protein [Pelosinus fermentans]|uniref:Aspartate/tyrosine/aromatic aminotransferase n=1 Tax=Pelosinus fermentans B4 TaxID=1149862 RepID=I9L8N2_9FIRM|nr:hypothetical protein [Pelosinus fermentans]EIW16641.1 aspartate/tyrosine/aromatic aminotransferase [Pelosinus fermentans B4]EIW22870.1 aspartate/tyrosine/aromatic aminotransferase [Pelosinus fermentans A11]